MVGCPDKNSNNFCLEKFQRFCGICPSPPPLPLKFPPHVCLIFHDRSTQFVSFCYHSSFILIFAFQYNKYLNIISQFQFRTLLSLSIHSTVVQCCRFSALFIRLPKHQKINVDVFARFGLF